FFTEIISVPILPLVMGRRTDALNVVAVLKYSEAVLSDQARRAFLVEAAFARRKKPDNVVELAEQIFDPNERRTICLEFEARMQNRGDMTSEARQRYAELAKGMASHSKRAHSRSFSVSSSTRASEPGKSANRCRKLRPRRFPKRRYHPTACKPF
ncbi:MAG: hypothetical protein ACI9DF_005704, partial [Verrucomicrobiales bacterium]